MTETYTDYLVADPDGDTPEPPTFYEISQLIESEGLVGEKDTALTVVVSTVRSKDAPLVMLVGIARGGKDEVLDKAFRSFTSDTVYEWSNGEDSDTAPFYAADEINSHPVHYMGDLASMNEVIERILKAWGEGKPAKRGKTDISREEDDQYVEQELDVPRVVFVTAATDNRNFSLADYPELEKRAFTLGVDGTKSQTEAIVRRKALEHMGQAERTVDPIQKAQIQNYMSSIPVEHFDSPSNVIRNPMAGEMANQAVLPTDFVQARFDIDRLLNFIGTISLINHTRRFLVDTGTGHVLLVTPVDVWYGMKIMGENMIMSSLGLSDEDQAVLRYLRESDQTPTRKDVQQGLRQAGWAITDKDVKQSLDGMRERGYVQEHDDSPKTYSLSPFASVTEHDVGLDYERIVDAAIEHVYNIPGVPEDVANAYVDRFCRGEGLFAIHPFTGETIDITDDNELQDALDSATDDVAAIFDSPFGAAAAATTDGGAEPDANDVDGLDSFGEFADETGDADDDTEARLV